MFRTEIEKSTIDFKIDQSKPLLSIGSCFSDTIGQKLSDAKFSILVNPYGTVFNPISIFNLLNYAITESNIDESTIIERDGRFLSHELHSSLNASSKEKLMGKFHRINQAVLAQIKKAEVLFLTFGSSWVYEKKRGGNLVSNCHKVPQKEFNKRLLSLDEITSGFFDMKEKLELLNPKLRTVLTVSPVRHTKEGLSGNMVSKSNLRLACHYLSEMAEDVYYFPSYEMLIDDLRDYRFYAKDLIHPNEQAVDYVWDHFLHWFLTDKAIKDHAAVAKIQSALTHRAFNPSGKAHQKFLKETLKRAEELNKQIGLKEEIQALKSKIQHD